MLTQQPSFRVRVVAPQRIEARQALHLGQHDLAVHAAVAPALLPALAVRQLAREELRVAVAALRGAQQPHVLRLDGVEVERRREKALVAARGI